MKKTLVLIPCRIFGDLHLRLAPMVAMNLLCCPLANRPSLPNPASLKHLALMEWILHLLYHLAGVRMTTPSR